MGIFAAYLIELILAKENFGSEIENENPYKIYKYAVIIKTDNNEKIMQPLVFDDMKKVKMIYIDWWDKNKNKSMDELRSDWKDNNRVLNNSEFVWN